MISNHVDNVGLLLVMYPRPVFVAAGMLDFFPIEGARKTVREVTELYRRFQHADRIGMAEGYHAHEFSLENQEAAMEFFRPLQWFASTARFAAGERTRRQNAAV